MLFKQIYADFMSLKRKLWRRIWILILGKKATFENFKTAIKASFNWLPFI